VPTFTEALDAQVALMRDIAQRVDARGWGLIVHRLNMDGRTPSHLYKFLSGGLQQFIIDYSSEAGMRPVLVHVWPDKWMLGDWKALDKVPTTVEALALDITFTARFDNLKHFGPIFAALELMSAEQIDNKQTATKGAGPLVRLETPTYVEFRGRGKTALQVLVRVLDMPQHRKLLMSRRVGRDG
jgi:hypothetical protein